MEIKYNNKIYYFSQNSTLENLLSREDLINLPLEVWYELMVLKNGTCFAPTMAKILKAKILDTDKKTNAFYFKGNSYWFDKNTRSSLLTLCERETVSIILDNEVYSFDSSKFKEFLLNLEYYANQCYITTHKHLNNISQLKSVAEIINYDYSKQYPDHITLNE